MDSTELKPLFDYLDEKFSGIDQRFEKLESRMNNLETAVANLASQVKTYHEEMLVMNHRVDRNEKWMREVSKKLGIPVPF